MIHVFEYHPKKSQEHCGFSEKIAFLGRGKETTFGRFCCPFQKFFLVLGFSMENRTSGNLRKISERNKTLN